MNIDLGTLKDLAGVPELIKEVLAAFAHAPAVFTDPKFMLGMVSAAVAVAVAKDDEGRREIIQLELARLQRKFQ